MDMEYDDVTKWLKTLPQGKGFFEISSTRAYAHAETGYDDQYGIDSANLNVGQGVVNLLRTQGADFSGPALEVGCGTGLLTLGLCAAKAYPLFVITDPSPAFLEITRNKLQKSGVDDSDDHCYATLSGDELDLLPAGVFSLIVLRSVVHHLLDAEKFIRDAEKALKLGGVLCFEEPCAEGYMLMGALAQCIPAVLAQAGEKLSAQQEQQLKLFCDTMKFYLRRDLDKSKAEDKHLFHVDEVMALGQRHGLSTQFFANTSFDVFAQEGAFSPPCCNFYAFFKSYLKYCMNFGEDLIQRIDKPFAPYATYIEKASRGGSGPYLNGVFVCRKT